MITLTRFFLLALYFLLLAGCLADWRFECESSLDCLAGDFCQMGRCVDLSPGTAGGHSRLGSNNHSDQTTSIDADAADLPDIFEEEVEPHPCPDAKAPTPKTLILNEVFANVPTGPEGDANGDGVRDAADDEFVELVNISSKTLDLTGVAVTNGGDPRFSFPPTCLEPGHAVVVFGGIRPGASPPSGEGWTSYIADRRFSFANGGGQATIIGADSQFLGELSYGSHPAQSLTRDPQLTGEFFVSHKELNQAALFSPGTCADGRPFTTGCPAPDPSLDE